MSSSPTVSIIVPVYNVAGYVGRCFDSIAAQTYPHLECIFVDDCGTDASMEIVRERMAAYRGNISFKIVRHEKNRGLSAARNTGTDTADGEYIWYVDPDDFINDDVVSDIFRNIEYNRPEIITFSYAVFRNGDDFSGRLVRVPPHKSVCEILEAICLTRRENWGAPFRIFSKPFLKQNNLSFKEGLIHEDVDFFMKLLQTKTTLIRTDQHCAYFYRSARDGSIMSSGFSEKRMSSLFELAEKSYGLAQTRDENFQIYVEVFREMLFSILSGCSSRKTANRNVFLLNLRSKKKKFGLLLKDSRSLSAKILGRLLPISVFWALVYWKIYQSLPCKCMVFAYGKLQGRLLRK